MFGHCLNICVDRAALKATRLAFNDSLLHDQTVAEAGPRSHEAADFFTASGNIRRLLVLDSDLTGLVCYSRWSSHLLAVAPSINTLRLLRHRVFALADLVLADLRLVLDCHDL